ncbi:MAG: alpha/beta hydrolase [Chloroflexi bacterium]|nr:alpha/beta hydrolase [Chloroflexota bacterium]MYE38629.1 alpha/beta hydrolase [Chloroflexota bacterium]
MHRIESGSGSPVVLLDWTPWQSSVLADALAVQYRVISIEPPDGDNVPALAQSASEAAASVAEAAGVDSYSLVGVSLGADVAFRLALARPEAVAALALVSPACIAPAESPNWDTPAQAADAMLAHPETASTGAPDASRTAGLAALAKRWGSTEGDAASILPDLACATLAVFGQEDRLVSREAGGVWKERAPNCNVCYVYDAGHAVAADRPDALVNVVLDFLERRETFVVENRSSLINP